MAVAPPDCANEALVAKSQVPRTQRATDPDNCRSRSRSRSRVSNEHAARENMDKTITRKDHCWMKRFSSMSICEYDMKRMKCEKESAAYDIIWETLEVEGEQQSGGLEKTAGDLTAWSAFSGKKEPKVALMALSMSPSLPSAQFFTFTCVAQIQFNSIIHIHFLQCSAVQVDRNGMEMQKQKLNYQLRGVIAGGVGGEHEGENDEGRQVGRMRKARHCWNSGDLILI